MYASDGSPITDIDLIEGKVLWEQKAAEGVSGTQTINKWVNENVYTKFFRYLTAREELPGFYNDASIGFDFTGKNIAPELRSAVEDQVGYLRSLDLGADIRLKFSG